MWTCILEEKVYHRDILLLTGGFFMDAILDKLTEIENAASAIVRHAEEQKDVLGQEFDEKRKKILTRT